MNSIAEGTLNRIRQQLVPQSDSIKDFVLKKTKLRGKPFSLKDHEYQGLILDTYSKKSIDMVIQKPSQLGISEIVYRMMLAKSNLIPGHSSAIVFPTAKMSNEVMSTRVAGIINESDQLRAGKHPDVDSNQVKMFRNNSIIYALGASPTSKSTVINRPISDIIVDELARCDLDVITALQSRQRHQDNKCSVMFSTPLFEGGDIDLEMQNCGKMYEFLLSCTHCHHKFFPDFYEHVKIPGYLDAIKTLTQELVESRDLKLQDAYLMCPECGKPTTHQARDFEIVDTCQTPGRFKVGIKLSAFVMPRYVGPHELVQSFLRYTDRNEFTQQVLGLPARKSDTVMDVTRFVFESADPSSVNVMGVDVGKVSNVFVASVRGHQLFIHHQERVPLSDLHRRVCEIYHTYNCLSAVIDYMPYTDVATSLMNTLPSCWVAIQIDPAVPIPELFRLKVKEDEAIGRIKFVQINKNLALDTYVNSLTSQSTTFRRFEPEVQSDIIAHHEAVRRMRDPRFIEERYKWVKPQGSKTNDHWFYTGLFTYVASRLITCGAGIRYELPNLMSSFRLRRDL